MSNHIREYIGSRVRYSKVQSATRNGWTGTLVNVKREGNMLKGIVEWDQTGEETPYQVTAFGFDRQGRVPDECVDGRYLYLMETGEDAGEGPLYIVTGENGGPMHRVRGAECALNFARRKAAESKSGQGYMIFRAWRVARRQDPPVSIQDIED